jgi:hypothetical protein
MASCDLLRSYEYFIQQSRGLYRLTLHLLTPRAPTLHQGQACGGSHPKLQPDLYSPDHAGKAHSKTGVQATSGGLLMLATSRLSREGEHTLRMIIIVVCVVITSVHTSVLTDRETSEVMPQSFLGR